MKVYLDDVREEPEGWVRTKTVAETIELLKTGEVTEISLDHDLGECAPPGIKVLDWILEQVLTGWQPPRKIWVHSQNPYGARAMRQLAERISHYYKEWIS